VKRLTSILGIAACLIAAGQALAAPINVAATHEVVVGDTAGGSVFGANSPSNALGLWGDDVAHSFTYPPKAPLLAQAHLSSLIGGQTTTFAATGIVAVDFSAQQRDGVFAQSIWDVSFDLAAANTYSLQGFLYASTDGGRGESIFQLFGAGPDPIISFDAISSDDFRTPLVNLLSSGTLAAGSYTLEVESILDNCVHSRLSTGTNNPCGPAPDSYMGGLPQQNGFDFIFNLADAGGGTPVPEPATLSLLGLGLAGVGFMRRRKAA
jgi:hypothetical protein